MSDVIALFARSIYRAESISDTPIYNALAAANPLSVPTVVPPKAARRLLTHREPASLSRSCLMPRSPMGGRHRRSLTVAEHAPRTGRHHLVAPVTPSYT